MDHHPWVSPRTLRLLLIHKGARMEQLTLPNLENTCLEVVLGVTEWAKSPPPSVGWWKCRVVGREAQAANRRYWNGRWWSMAVAVGDDDATAAEQAKLPAVPFMNQIEWCGLARDPKEL